jgi:DNA polymerase
MPKYPGASGFVPSHPTLEVLREAVQQCRGCDLYRNATQAVGGEGRASARIILVGEQPGDREDRAGRPFVGPAGAMLDRALVDAGIDRADAYVTNAVRHFKFEERGKRRIHKKPGDSEIDACRPWLLAEMECLHPSAIVCLGATAARSITGKHHQLLKERGRFVESPLAKFVTATVHPSAILRAPDAERRHAEYEAFVRDLANVAKALRAAPSKGRHASH